MDNHFFVKKITINSISPDQTVVAQSLLDPFSCSYIDEAWRCVSFSTQPWSKMMRRDKDLAVPLPGDANLLLDGKMYLFPWKYRFRRSYVMMARVRWSLIDFCHSTSINFKFIYLQHVIENYPYSHDQLSKSIHGEGTLFNFSYGVIIKHGFVNSLITQFLRAMHL